MRPVKVNIGIATRDELPHIVTAAEAFATAIGRSLDLEYEVYCGPTVNEFALKDHAPQDAIDLFMGKDPHR